MRKSIYNILLVIVIMTSVTGCRKDNPNVLHPSNAYPFIENNYWSALFYNYWNGMNQSYVFWDIDPTDWDAIYEKYTPKFLALDNSEILDEEINKSAALYFEDITSTLIDHHYNLSVKDLGSFSGSEKQISKRDYFHPSDITLQSRIRDAITTDNNYEVLGFIECEYAKEEGSFNALAAEYDGIAYLSISEFAMTTYLNQDIAPIGTDSMIDVLNYFNQIINETPNFKGAIIDVRNNGGGQLEDLKVLLGQYISKSTPLAIAYTRHKSGPGRLEYSPFILQELPGVREGVSKTFPIAVLVNLYSVSMSEMTSLTSKQFNAQSVIIGERTYGGQGPLTKDFIYAGGQINTDNFKLYTSSCIYYDINKQNYEGVGVTPDIEMLENDVINDLINNGNDLILNRAIKYLGEL